MRGKLRWRQCKGKLWHKPNTKPKYTLGRLKHRQQQQRRKLRRSGKLQRLRKLIQRPLGGPECQAPFIKLEAIMLTVTMAQLYSLPASLM